MQCRLQYTTALRQQRSGSHMCAVIALTVKHNHICKKGQPSG